MRKHSLKFSIGRCKGILAALLLAAGAFSSALAAPVEYTDELFTWSLDNGQATLVSYNAKGNTEVTVPDSVVYNGGVYRVTVLGEGCFVKADFKKITLGKYVTRINDEVFKNAALNTIVFGSSLEYIGSFVFRNCRSLVDLTLPPSLISVAESAFQQSGIVNLDIGAGLKNIDPEAFFRTPSLARITVPEDNPYFKAEDGILYSKNGTELVFCPPCHSGSNLTVPGSVRMVWPYAFNYLDSVRNITFSEGVEQLSDNVFYNSRLTTLSIPASLRYIGASPFEGCGSLTTITVAPGSQWFEVKDGWFVDKGQKKLVFHMGEFPSDVVIPDGIEVLGDQLFRNSSITSVTFPPSLHKIGYFCFKKCAQLKEIKGSMENIDTLMYYAFDECSQLKDFRFGPKLRYVGELSLGRTAITSVDFKENMSFLGSSAFLDCQNLTSVSVSNPDCIIGTNVFNGCVKLESVSLPKGIRKIPGNLFVRCTSLKQFTIPATVDTIGDLAFYGSGLETLDIPASVRYIDHDAFYSCTGLREIVIPDNVEYIGRSCFNRCSGVKTVKIGKGLKSVGEYAFNPLVSLTTLELSEGLERIEKAGFANCPLLRELTLPSTLTYIDTLAFANDSLTFIRAKMLTPPALKGVIFTNSNLKTPKPATDFATCVLEVPQESLELYKNAEIWKEFVNLRGDGVEGIGNDADVTVREIYTVTGLRLTSPAPGQINILRMSDGSVRKIFIPR